MPELIFISQPMNDKSDIEIKKAKAKAIKEVKKLFGEDVIIMDTFCYDSPPPDTINKPLWYMGESLKMMSHANIVYLAKGYEESRGCLIEKMCAEYYNKFIYTHYDYLSKFSPEDDS